MIIELYIRTRGRTGDAACTNGKGSQARHTRHFARTLNIKYMLVRCYDNAMQCFYINLRNGRTPGQVSKLVCPLLLINNSMVMIQRGKNDAARL